MRSRKKKFMIYDWAGNVKFGGRTFPTFEDAWEYLYSKFESDEDLQEFEVRIEE